MYSPARVQRSRQMNIEREGVHETKGAVSDQALPLIPSTMAAYPTNSLCDSAFDRDVRSGSTECSPLSDTIRGGKLGRLSFPIFVVALKQGRYRRPMRHLQVR